ncbi:MAG: lysophospholipid acyltransferase family protein [Bacteroidetes bacterium]|nr:lysophospholipid acyltransferase family protein [Bacteroidota bacterium]
MKIQYRLFTLLANTVSSLSFPALYRLSDVVSFLLYHVIRYRKKVVFTNLRNSFPEKSSGEITCIARKYYHNLADIILEVLKTQTITLEEMGKRIVNKNFEVVRQYLDNHRSVILATGHVGNWEWLGTYYCSHRDFTSWGVVKPLSDKFFDSYINGLRMKFSMPGKGLIDYRKAFREMVSLKNELCMTAIIGDQTPVKSEINYWTTFLNQETPVFLGIEKISKSLNQPVIFMNMQRTGRGHYTVEFTLITDKPKESSEYEIWLWSHKRWKHRKD